MVSKLLLMCFIVGLTVGCIPDRCDEFLSTYSGDERIEGIVVPGGEFWSGDGIYTYVMNIENGDRIDNAECFGYFFNVDTYDHNSNILMFNNSSYFQIVDVTPGLYNYTVICFVNETYFGTGYNYVCVR